MTWSDMVTKSILTRSLAAIFLFAVLLVALAVGGYDLFLNRDVPSVVSTLIGGGVVYSCVILGINLGIILQPAPEIPQTSKPSTGGPANAQP